MTNIQTKNEITSALQDIREQVKTTASNLSDAEFFTGTAASWSAADYLKHIILSVKPFARGIGLPPEQLKKIFGTTTNGSIGFDELVAKYHARLDEGIRAEDSPNVTPVNYKFPDGVEDNIQSYLVETWDKANGELITNLENWSEADLDTYVLPHPAIGNITIREMCFFTIHHNRMHHQDIQQAASAL